MQYFNVENHVLDAWLNDFEWMIFIKGGIYWNGCFNELNKALF